MGRGWRGEQRGSVVVEIALAIPALVAVVVALVWVISMGATYVRALDAAQTAARELARGTAADAVGVGVERSLPGAQLAITPEGEFIRTEVSREVAVPVPVLRGIQVTIRADAVALREPGIEP